MNPHPRLYTTRNEVIEREIVEPLAVDLDDLLGDAPDAMVRLYYDIDAIADETITTAVTEGGQLRYCQDPGIDVDLFWEIVERHALSVSE